MATYTVTTLDDELNSTDPNATIGDFGGAGDLSLREALVLANQTLAVPDTITFDATFIGGTLTLSTGELIIESDVTIDGDLDDDSRPDITLDADGNSGNNWRVLSVGNVTATLDGLVITGGNAGYGAGVETAAADLTIRNSVITDNHIGGGIRNVGTLTLDGVTVSGNSSITDAGGIGNGLTGAALHITNSTIANNTANFNGGGLVVIGGTEATLTNVTLFGNNASGGYGGGAIFSGGDLTLTQVTITGNQASAANAGGIYIGAGSLAIANSIIAGNHAAVTDDDAYDRFAAIDYQGVNIVGTGSDIDASDHVIQAPTLGDLFLAVAPVDPDGGGGQPAFNAGVLADNSGLVQTVAIRATSVAADAADDAAAVYDDDQNPVTPDVAIPTDARGFGRTVGAHVDIGAVEAQAGQSFVVTTLDDELDSLDPHAALADFGGSGDLSLREALILANQDPTSPDTITFDGGLSGGALTASVGELTIASDVTIDGDFDDDGAADITLDADGNSWRVLNVGDVIATLDGLIITGGNSSYGAGVVTSGGADLTIRNSTITDNHIGGGIRNVGRLTLDRVTVSGNSSTGDAGGIANALPGAVLNITNSTIADNTAAFNGGALTIIGGSQATLTNVTLFGNNAGGIYGGGAIFSGGDLTLTQVTITGNQASAASGGGLYIGAGSVVVANSIIVGNHAVASGNDTFVSNAANAIDYQGVNIVGTGSDIDASDHVIEASTLDDVFATVAPVDPDGGGGQAAFNAGVLADNGGPVQTVAINPRGIAVDTGDDAAAVYDDDHNPATPDVAILTDARGAGRPNGTQVDIGAFEAQNLVVTTLDDVLDSNDPNATLADFGGAGDLSLREALVLANNNGTSPDLITFDATLAGETIYLASGGELVIDSNGITIDGDIDGDGIADITLSADSADGAGDATTRVLHIAAAGTVHATVNGLVIRDGNATTGGGGILVGESNSITLTNSSVSHNYSSSGGQGGGLYGLDGSSVVIVNSTIDGNSAAQRGGGIFVRDNATLTLINSTVSDNSSVNRGGGGIGGRTLADITLVNTTVTGNVASYGGGIYAKGPLKVINSTITGNAATGTDGGGIYNYTAGGVTTLTNSIVAGNIAATAGGADLTGSSNPGQGSLVLTGNNILGSTPYHMASVTGVPTLIDGTSASDLQNVFASVGSNPNSGVLSGLLTNNGGPVLTVAIKAGGIAHDAGDDSLVPQDTHDLDNDDITAEPLPADARGAPRLDGAHVDIGAVEAQATPLTLVITTLEDGGDDDFDGGDLFAELTDGDGLSLREALALANADPDANTITFDASLSLGTITLDGTELVISTNVTIDGDVDGDGKADIAIDADNDSRVLHVTGGVSTLHALTITGGTVTGLAQNGAGILVDQTAALTIANSTVVDNHGDAAGGGIANDGLLTLNNVLIAANTASDGAGVYNSGTGTANLTNTTVYGNYASNAGGGVENLGTAALTNVTITGNVADGFWGGGILSASNLTLTNSIVAGNDAPVGTDLAHSGTLTTNGTNLFSQSGIGDAGDIDDAAIDDIFQETGTILFTGVDGGVLGDNGGPTLTVAIKAGGLAQDAPGTILPGDTTDADGDSNTGEPLPIDARGFARDVGGVDIGAVELQAGQSFVVTTLDDELDSADPNATLADFGGAGNLSLREALALANHDPLSADTITFASALVGGSTPGVDDGMLALTQGALVIRGDATIDGDVNGDHITIDAQGQSRVITALNGTTTLNGLTITGGYAFTGGGITVGFFGLGTPDVTISNSVITGNEALYGGGIAVDIGGSLHLTNSVVANNSAEYAGGGIANKGTLTVTNALLTANTSGYIGGGIANQGTLTVLRSTLSSNQIVGSAGSYAPNAGAGLYNDGDAVVTSSTISGNTGAVFGGGIYNAYGLTLTNVTIANNAATYGGGLYDSTCGCAETTLINSTLSGNYAEIGGGILHADGILTIANSIVAGNGASYSDPQFVTEGGTVTLSGVNLFSQSGIGRSGIDITETDLTKIFATLATIDPDNTGTGDEFQAGLLANNGGPVQTIAIRGAGGVALNAGDNSVLPADTENLDGDADVAEDLPFDARGLPRISAGTVVDIGAFELQDAVPVASANTGLTLNEGASAAITAAMLDFDDAEQADAAITYTITTAPTNGVLSRSGVTLALNSTFTQADINNGLIAYTHNGGETTSASFGFSVGDGIAPAVTGQSFNFTINPVNDAPVNTLPATQEIEANTATAIAGLSIADPDAGGGSLTTTLSVTHGTLTAAAIGGAGVTGSGTGTVTITGTPAQINTALGSGNIVYQGAHDFFGNDALHVVTNDGGNTGVGTPLTDTDNVTIHLNTHLSGTTGDDSYTALPGNERIDAGHGVDSLTLGFNLTDATITWSGNTVTIDGPGGSHTVTSGFERYVFNDGTVDNNDGNPLVDDLFYYAQNHDVWTAHVDADFHYAAAGWHEGRDPDAFFSTTTYLALNPDVKQAGINPLDHWHASGWLEGRLPSFAFDPAAYLAQNPDVAAAHIDPLAHFLLIGASEGRPPVAVTALIARNGFDFVYYLQQNPDVAAAGVDPFLHFQTTGWHEGRDPNALFDVAGYLTHYSDVAAAGVNPLDHYHLVGWTEGRDPSLDFDTAAYLTANPDVAAAHIDPLKHYLQFGIHEGRTAIADGTWG